jgi:predicted TIM-barrel fold metal-dependent hydrolase
MDVAGLTLVSVADQLVEPPDTFAKHFPAKLADRAPRLVPGPDGEATWTLDGTVLGTPGGARRAIPLPDADPDGPYPALPPALHDPAARVRAMDTNGVLAAASYPTLAALTGARLAELPDAELARAVISAYNDWQADEWCAAFPGRLIPLGLLPVWDIDAAVAEAVRVAAKGVRALAFPEMPYSVDLPSFSTDHWDPLLRVIVDNDIALCLQGEGTSDMLGRPDDAPANPFASQADLAAPQLAATACTDLVVSGVLNRFPELRIGMSHGGIGWIPVLLDRIDLHLTNQQWLALDVAGLTGTEVFRRNFVAGFTTDPSTLYLRERIGVQSITWQASFPTVETTWPQSPELLIGELEMAGVTEDETAAITWRNACRLFRFDPFASREPADATVGALRAASVAAGGS